MVVRRIAGGLVLLAVVAACTETPRAVQPAPAGPARAVVVSEGAVRAGTPIAPIAPREMSRPAAERSTTPAASRPADGALAARQLAQTAPPARTKPASTPAKPSAFRAKSSQTAADGKAEPLLTPKPTMRPAHIPRREARPVFAPGRTSFVREGPRDGVGFYRAGELTPAPPVYAQLRSSQPGFEDGELLDAELEEATP